MSGDRVGGWGGGWWRRKKRRKRAGWRWRTRAVERLEERAMLAFQSPPVWGLPVAGSPVDVAVGPVDRDAWEDLVSLAEDGRLTVARNGGDGSWNSTVASDLGLVEPVTAHGLTLGLLDGDSLLDAVIQHSDGITVARGDGSGSFVPQWTWRAGSSGSLAPADGGRVGLAATLVNEDFFTDLIAVSPSGDEVLVFWGRGSGDAAGPLQSPVRYASGGREPVDVVVGQFVGDALPGKRGREAQGDRGTDQAADAEAVRRRPERDRPPVLPRTQQRRGRIAGLIERRMPRGHRNVPQVCLDVREQNVVSLNWPSRSGWRVHSFEPSDNQVA